MSGLDATTTLACPGTELGIMAAGALEGTTTRKLLPPSSLRCRPPGLLAKMTGSAGYDGGRRILPPRNPTARSLVHELPESCDTNSARHSPQSVFCSPDAKTVWSWL